jgi:hypothetical protein
MNDENIKDIIKITKIPDYTNSYGELLDVTNRAVIVSCAINK